MKVLAYSVAVAVAAAITFGNLRPAYGAIVFDNTPTTAADAAVTPQVAPQQVAPQDENDNMTKSEMLRRQRLREELKNEDLLTEKLEELRLKDEMKRTQEILGSGVDKNSGQVPVAQQQPTQPSLQEERVGSATTDLSAASATAPTNPALASKTSDVAMNTPAQDTIVASAPVNDTSSDEDSGQRVTITGVGGTANITNSIYDVSAKYAAGFNLAVDMTDHISFTGGYTYASYTLGAGNAMQYPMGFNQGYLQTLTLNDNVINLGARGYLLGRGSKLRPFAGAGVAYRRGYVNYDQTTQNFIRQFDPNSAQDVEISGFAGFLETGLEFKLTKSISLTGSFRYFNLFSSSQSNPLNPYGFVGPNGYSSYGASVPYYGAAVPAGGYGAYGYNSDTRSQAGGALAQNNFYQLLAGVSISF